MVAATQASERVKAPGAQAAALRAALGQFATGVTIVTTATPEGQRVGLTANSFTSVSLDPPLVLWSLSKRSASLQIFRSAPHFAVNVLSASQQDLCDRFEGVALAHSDHGLPVIDGALACFECSTYAQYEAGDHVVFLGRVERHRARDGDALIFRAGRMLSSAALSN
jgi:flavin reductase (DIM6/NTAB) family NADH-FMN oxidoreductase RutF